MRQVHDLLVLAVESDVDILDGRVPEPLDVVVGALEQLIECLDPVPVHESLEPAPFDDLAAGFPDHIADDNGLH